MSTPQQIEAGLHRAAEKLRNPSEMLAKIGNVALAAGKKETPVRSGTLRRSEGMRSDATSATLYATAEYGWFVHEGTSRMAARRFFHEGVQDVSGQIEEELQRLGDAAFSEVGT